MSAPLNGTVVSIAVAGGTVMQPVFSSDGRWAYFADTGNGGRILVVDLNAPVGFTVLHTACGFQGSTSGAVLMPDDDTIYFAGVRLYEYIISTDTFTDLGALSTRVSSMNYYAPGVLFGNTCGDTKNFVLDVATKVFTKVMDLVGLYVAYESGNYDGTYWYGAVRKYQNSVGINPDDYATLVRYKISEGTYGEILGGCFEAAGAAAYPTEAYKWLVSPQGVAAGEGYVYVVDKFNELFRLNLAQGPEQSVFKYASVTAGYNCAYNTIKQQLVTAGGALIAIVS